MGRYKHKGEKTHTFRRVFLICLGVIAAFFCGLFLAYPLSLAFGAVASWFA